VANVVYTDDMSPKHRSGGAGLRVTDPSDLCCRETNRRIDRRSREQDIHHSLLTASADSTDQQYQVCNWFCDAQLQKWVTGQLFWSAQFVRPKFDLVFKF